VIAHISHPRVQGVLELAHFAKQFKPSALALLPPIYYHFSQDDIAEYLIHIARAVQYPLCLYDFPELTGNPLQIETINRVASHVPVAAVKHSGGDFAFLTPLVAAAKKHNFKTFTGNDILLPEALSLGVYGCVSGLMNGVPELILQAFKPDQRERVGSKLKKLGSIMSGLDFPLNYAAVIEACGFSVGTPKMPLSAVSHAKYRKMVEQVRAVL
jgi:4-hydroxy-tetrahydrodipicolinate synthase